MFTWALQNLGYMSLFDDQVLLDNNWKHREQQAFVEIQPAIGSYRAHLTESGCRETRPGDLGNLRQWVMRNQ